MEILDRKVLAEVKRAFVAMPAGADPSMGAGPVAGGGMLTQAQASPMGGTPQVDPAAAGGMPIDPNTGAPMDMGTMGGGAPMDPAAMGGGGGMPVDPNTGMPVDPAAMGAMPAEGMPPEGEGAPVEGEEVPPPTGQLVMSPAEFIAILTACQGGAAGKLGKSGGSGGGKADTNSKLDQILQALGGQPAPAPQPEQSPQPQQ